jgi:hypothetical protein
MAKGPPPFSAEIQGFIKAYADDVADGSAAVFAGAGLSVQSGYVNWADLLRDIATELELDVDRETNLVAVAQYHLNERGTRSRINQKIIDEFSRGHDINDNHRILSRLPISTYWTTNYDTLIEDSLEEVGKRVDVKHAVPHLKQALRGRHATVYKMHGDVSDPENAVLTKDDYEGYFRDREMFVTALAGYLVSKTILFVGFSFTDPNIDYILSRIRVVLRHKPKSHYCILRKVSRNKREKADRFEYRRRQQQYFVKDLARIGVQALMVDEYRDVTRMLAAIEERYRRRSVFVSGSADDYSPWRSDKAAKFLEALSAGLVKNGMNLVTGFGLGVGPSIISGAWQVILAHPKRFTANQLQAHPFPADEGTAPARRRLYRRYRESMIDKAGIAIFLFGNKRDKKGALVEADGVREEFEIARAQGLECIAVGATGWMAGQLAAELKSTIAGRSARYRKAFAVANDSSAPADAVVAAVLQMVREARS